MRYPSTLLVLLVCAVGCQGPISDWPSSKGGDDTDGLGDTPVVPGSAGGVASGPAISPPATGMGSTPQPTAPTGTPGGSTAGSPAGGLIGGSVGGLTGGGAGGTAADAGTGAPRDAGAAIGDAATPAMDGGMPLPDGAVPDAAGDAGCVQPSSSDAGFCPSFGCRTREQLRAAVAAQGACSSEQAIALACDGRVGKAALECTQESVFSLGLERSVTMCLKRDAAIAQLSSACLDCYVDDALCTLSRCFAACTLTEGSDCKSCRQQQCSAAFARCSGLPSPTF